MGAIEIAVLGPVRLMVDHVPVVLASAQQRVLLARLALEAGRPVSTSSLIDTLWPGDAPGNAQGNLQSYASRLRRVIGADRLVHEPGGYRLALGPTDVDVGVAEALVAESVAIAAADPSGAADRLDDALALWRGDPLADLPDPVAFAPDLAHLAAWRRQLTEDRAELRLAAGDAAAAIPELERAVVVDPLRERAVVLLMRALHDAGRTTDALTAASSYRRCLAEGTGLDPGPEVRALEQQILTEDPALRTRPQRRAAGSSGRSASAPRPPADLFVGRRDETRDVRHALDQHRLVTVVGPGGIGKTRLVLELLPATDGPSDSLADDAGGSRETAFVELASVTRPEEVAAAAAAALGLTWAPTGIIDALIDRLSGGPSLVVLDSCEHVARAVAGLVATLLVRCPELSVLATSRRRLGVVGECVVRLAPLPTAAQVELFCARAAMLRSGFEGSAPARHVVAEICRHLDGLPLAVELAAQREAVFGLPQLRGRMAAGLDLLDPVGSGEGVGGIAPAVEWSYRLLDDSSRVLFDRLAVCADGFSLDALAHFAPVESRAEVLLAELVDASMVLIDHGQDPPRYRILEPIRQAGERHLDQPRLRAAEVAHTSWMRHHLAVARAAQDQRLPEAGRLLGSERANLRHALRRALEGEAWEDAASLGIQTALLVVDNPRLDLIDQLTQLDRVADHAEVADVADDVAARCLAAAGTARWLSGRADAGVTQCSAAVDLLPDAWAPLFLRCMGRVFVGDVDALERDARTLLDRPDSPAWVRATAVCLAALLNEFSGDHGAATGWVDSHSDLLAQVGAVDGFVSYTRGELMVAQDPVGALHAFEDADARCRAGGQEYNRRVAQVGRAGVLIRLGDDAAVPACTEALTGLRDAGMWPQVWMLLRLVAGLLVQRGAPATAVALLDAADADPLAPPVLEADRERIALLRRAVAAADSASQTHTEADTGTCEGTALSRTQAVAIALDALAPHP